MNQPLRMYLKAIDFPQLQTCAQERIGAGMELINSKSSSTQNTMEALKMVGPQLEYHGRIFSISFLLCSCLIVVWMPPQKQLMKMEAKHLIVANLFAVLGIGSSWPDAQDGPRQTFGTTSP